MSGKIVHHRDGVLRIDTEGGPYEVRSEDIRDIDHPGDGALVAAGALGAYGAYFLWPRDCDGSCTTSNIIGTLMLTAGLGMALFGGATKMGSVRRAQPERSEKATTHPISDATQSARLGPRQQATDTNHRSSSLSARPGQEDQRALKNAAQPGPRSAPRLRNAR